MKSGITGIKLLCYFWWKIVLQWLTKILSLLFTTWRSAKILFCLTLYGSSKQLFHYYLRSCFWCATNSQDNAVIYSNSLQSEQSRYRIPVEVHPASYKEVLGLSKRVKRPGCGADHQHLSSAKSANGLELYTSGFSLWLYWNVTGWPVPLLTRNEVQLSQQAFICLAHYKYSSM